ncbi:hypothetical protein ACFQJ7_15830 [Halovenus rubra]|uniref:Uncharacterized protein n=2 Tax=Halovenus rubra TaxID=869890 RepID=A0ACC7E2M6_9EURY|nr:hypothetical protein [Halovenus rubra]
MSGDTPTATRRTLISGAAALVTTAVSGSTAGCLSLLPPVGQEVRYGRVDTPTPIDTEPAYREWIPVQAELPAGEDQPDVQDLVWVSVTPGELGREAIGAEFRVGADVAMSPLDYFGYAFQHYDYVHGLGGLGTVAEGDIETETVTSTLQNSGYSHNGTYHGWELFDRTDIPRTVAVSKRAIVQSYGNERRPIIETVLDAGDGRIARHHEQDKVFETFSDWVGSSPTILEAFGSSFPDFEPSESALAYNFDDDAAYFIYHQQYAHGETPTKGEIQEALEKSTERAMQAWAVDIEIDGTQVAIQMRVEEDEFQDDAAEDRAPYLTWGVDDRAATVTIRHEAGDTIPVDQVDIEPQNALVDKPEPGTLLEPGDELEFTTAKFPESEDDISVFYNYAENSSNSIALLHYEPNELESDA